MKIIMFLMVLMSVNAYADEFIVLNISSNHVKVNDDRYPKGVNEENYGIGYDNGDYSFGVYKNSYHDTSIYIGGSKVHRVNKFLKLSVEYGVATGYDSEYDLTFGGLLPYVLPSITVGSDFGVKIGLVPTDDGTLTFQIVQKL